MYEYLPREAAWQLLTTYNQEPFHLQHAIPAWKVSMNS